MASEDEETNSIYDDVAREAANFDGINREMIDCLGFNATIMRTPVTKRALKEITECSKGNRLLTVLKQMKELESKTQDTGGETSNNCRSIVKVMEGINNTFKAQQQYTEEKNRGGRMKNWIFGEFKPSANEKFRAGEVKFYLSGLNDYMEPRQLSDEEKIHILKYRTGTYIGELVRIMPKSKNIQVFKEFCKAITSHINPNDDKETMKQAFMEFQQEKEESNT